MIRLRLISGDAAGALVAVNNAGITVYDAVCSEDGIEVEFSIRRQDRKVLEKLVYRRGYDLKILQNAGLYWLGGRILKRPVALCAAAVLLVLTMYLPSRILFIRVEGNESVPTRLILEQCQACGVGFGASRKAVRSEKAKNALLEAVPELQWAGVTTSGCVATVTVREREIKEPTPEKTGVNCIVASRDGIITECTVTKGTSLCQVGQAVSAGDVLVSGYTDCGICIQATGAEAEIYAETYHELTVVTPTDWTQETENQVSEKKYALIIGKKRINFYKGSGISGTTCDKIYEENYITLPGGFQLPVAIVTETWTYCDSSDVEIINDGLLPEFAESCLHGQMTAGTILSSDGELSQEDGILCWQGNFTCVEMIARVQSEEILKPYGNDN